MVDVTPRPLYPRYLLYRSLGWTQGRSGRVQKNLLSPGFDLRAVRPVASGYTDWAIPAITAVLTITVITLAAGWIRILIQQLRVAAFLSFQSCCQSGDAVLLFLRQATVINIAGILEEIPASNFKTELSKERKCLEDRRSLRPMGEKEATRVRCPSH